MFGITKETTAEDVRTYVEQQTEEYQQGFWAGVVQKAVADAEAKAAKAAEPEHPRAALTAYQKRIYREIETIDGLNERWQQSLFFDGMFDGIEYGDFFPEMQHPVTRTPVPTPTAEALEAKEFSSVAPAWRNWGGKREGAGRKSQSGTYRDGYNAGYQAGLRAERKRMMPKQFSETNPNADPYREAPAGKKVTYQDGTEETYWGPWSLTDLLFRRWGYPLHVEKRKQISKVEDIPQ